MNVLPPIGQIQPDQEGEVLAFWNDLDRECNDSRRAWAELADQGSNVFLLGDDTADATVYANDIQDAVIAIADVQSKEPPVTELEASDTGDEPTAFWVGTPEEGMAVGLDPAFVAPTADPMTMQEIPPAPLPPALAKQLELMGVDDSLICRVNAETTSEFYQLIFDKTWQRSRLDQWFRTNVIDTNIAGWKVDLYERNPDGTVCMTELSVHQAYLDPTQRTLERMAYAGVDVLVDEGWALRRYPHIADTIRENAKDGQPYQSSSGLQSLGDLENVNFARRMVKMRMRWMRNQPLPMGKDEAIASGGIIEQQVPDEAAIAAMEEQGNEPNTDNGTNDFDRTDEYAESRESVHAPTGPDVQGVTPQDGEPLEMEPVQPPLPTRLACCDPESGEELTPGHEKWPVKYALRRTVFVNDVRAEDVVEEAWDIPLVHNICIQIPRKPWGIGEPYRQLNKQKARNRILGAIVDHSDHNAHPSRVMSEGMYAATAAVQDTFNEPGAIIIIPTNEWQLAGGKVSTVEELPQLAPHLMDTQQLLKAEITDSSGNVDVMQGRAQPGVESGKAIELLQSAASSTASLKSQFAGDMVYRLDQLMLYDIVHYTTVEDVLKITRKYPPHVIQEFLRRGKDIEWSTSVSIAGGGALRQQKRQRAIEDLQVGAIGIETYRDQNNIDHKQEEQRAKRQMEVMAQQAAASGVQPEPQQGNKTKTGA